MSFILPESEDEWQELANSLSEDSMSDLADKSNRFEDAFEDEDDEDTSIFEGLTEESEVEDVADENEEERESDEHPLPPDPMVQSIFEQRLKFWQVRGSVPRNPMSADEVLDFHSFIHGLRAARIRKGERDFFDRMKFGPHTL